MKKHTGRKQKRITSDWVEVVASTVEFPGYTSRVTAIEKLKECLGEYSSLEGRMTAVNVGIYQNFTFHTAETIFERIANFETNHLCRFLVLEKCTLYTQDYFTGAMGPQRHVALEGIAAFAPSRNMEK